MSWKITGVKSDQVPREGCSDFNHTWRQLQLQTAGICVVGNTHTADSW